jgi:UDP-glucose 4-epimerase
MGQNGIREPRKVQVANGQKDELKAAPARGGQTQAAPSTSGQQRITFRRDNRLMANILVTGAAGFIGSHTAELLVAGGHRVIGVDNFRTGRRSNLEMLGGNPAFQLFERDVARRGELDAVVAESMPDAIIHLAALVSVRQSIDDPELNFLSNHKATFEVAEAARRHGVARVVFASSAAVYGDSERLPLNEGDPGHPISPYGAAKLSSESLLLGHAAAYGFTVCCLRYFNVYGPRQDPSSPYSGVITILLRDFMENQPFTLYGDGNQTRDFVHVGDAARANALAATRPNLKSGAMNICTGRQTSIQALLEIVSSQFPSAPGWERAPARTGDILHSLGDPAKARAGLDFSPRTEIGAGLAEMIRTRESAESR